MCKINWKIEVTDYFHNHIPFFFDWQLLHKVRPGLPTKPLLSSGSSAQRTPEYHSAPSWLHLLLSIAPVQLPRQRITAARGFFFSSFLMNVKALLLSEATRPLHCTAPCKRGGSWELPVRQEWLLPLAAHRLAVRGEYRGSPPYHHQSVSTRECMSLISNNWMTV